MHVVPGSGKGTFSYIDKSKHRGPRKHRGNRIGASILRNSPIPLSSRRLRCTRPKQPHSIYVLLLYCCCCCGSPTKVTCTCSTSFAGGDLWTSAIAASSAADAAAAITAIFSSAIQMSSPLKGACCLVRKRAMKGSISSAKPSPVPIDRGLCWDLPLVLGRPSPLRTPYSLCKERLQVRSMCGFHVCPKREEGKQSPHGKNG